MRHQTGISTLTLYRKFLSMHLRTALEYKSSFIMTLFGQTLTSLASFFAIWILFDRFHSINGYTLSEVLLCYATILLGFSFSEIFLRGFDTFSGQVQSGSFDRLLLRPRSLLFSVLVSRVEFARIGRFLQGIAVMAYVVTHAGIVWTVPRIGAYILMIVGCIVFFSALLILQAGVCFFTIEGLEVMNIFTHGGKELGSYPLDIYRSNALILFFTCVVPLACAQYYPFLYLIGHRQSLLYALSPLWTCGFLFICICVWNCGVCHYQSTGS